jgi:DNA repair protein RAD51
VSEEEDSQMDQ